MSPDPGPPDFVGVGSQRSGTSWWFSLLLRHPGIARGVESRKELHYFDQYCDRDFTQGDIARYHANFPHSPDLLKGEWTPRYMFDFWTPRLLAEAAPRARLLVMLRDPVERFRSGVEHEGELRGRRPWQRKLLTGAALGRSRYRDQLRRLCDYFPRSQILVLQYEQCVAEPARFYGRTLSFLGVAQFDLAEDQMRKTVGSVTRCATLPAHLRAAVVDELREDVRLLGSEFPEVETSLWPDFAPETAPAP